MCVALAKKITEVEYVCCIDTLECALAAVSLQLLLNDMDYCSGQQVSLGAESTSLTSADRVQSVPLLPIPFINSSLTRVVFQMGVNSQHLRRLINEATPTETNEGEGQEVRSLGKEKMREILQQLSETDSGSRDPKPLIIGARDFNLLQMRGSVGDWRGLEELGARGPRGTPRENFQPCVVVMDHGTENSSVPHCVVNGEWEMTGKHYCLHWVLLPRVYCFTFGVLSVRCVCVCVHIVSYCIKNVCFL